MGVAKVINEVKEEGVSFGKVVLGSVPVAVGGAVGDFVGALIGGYVAQKIVKGKKEQEVIKVITYLTAADLFLEKFIKPRGIVG